MTSPRLEKIFHQKSSWIELNRQSFLDNIKTYRDLLPGGIQFGGVLKGNAYGHGFNETLSIVYEALDIVFVVSPADGLYIRNYEKKKGYAHKRVIVLGAITPREAVMCAKKELEVMIGDRDWGRHIHALKKLKQKTGKENYRPLLLHAHIDTGLGREGFYPEKLLRETAFIQENAELMTVCGVMSHFADTEDVTEQRYAEIQLENLEKAIASLAEIFKRPLERHIAQSAATLVLPKSRYDIVRIGIALYGLWPSSNTKLSCQVVFHKLPRLKPVLSWKCKSQSIKKIPAGSYIGYGCSYKADRNLTVALLPVGYFDGYPRLLSNKAYVLVNGVRCKVLGRVMMNHIVVDITEAKGDGISVIATLIGQDREEFVSVEHLAEWAQTINYEIVARLGAHLTRKIKPS